MATAYHKGAGGSFLERENARHTEENNGENVDLNNYKGIYANDEAG
jgi:hypothetical protein